MVESNFREKTRTVHHTRTHANVSRLPELPWYHSIQKCICIMETYTCNTQQHRHSRRRRFSSGAPPSLPLVRTPPRASLRFPSPFKTGRLERNTPTSKARCGRQRANTAATAVRALPPLPPSNASTLTSSSQPRLHLKAHQRELLRLAEVVVAKARDRRLPDVLVQLLQRGNRRGHRRLEICACGSARGNVCCLKKTADGTGGLRR